MPEVPEQMQNEIAAMELEATNPPPKPVQTQPKQQPVFSQAPTQDNYTQRPAPQNQAPSQYTQSSVQQPPGGYSYDNDRAQPSQGQAPNAYGQNAYSQAPPAQNYNQNYTNTPQQGYQEQQIGGTGSFPPRHSSVSGTYKDLSVAPAQAQPPTPPKQQQPPPPQQQQQQSHDYMKIANVPDLPNFSPFPKLVNPPKNVPPSDEEKEAILETARVPVLNSNDPEMQLAWAHDALIYVEAAQSYEQRISERETARPTTPQVEHQLRADAMNIVSFLANQHHPKAEFLRGMWLEFGKFGQRIDKKEAFMCYARAAEKGYSRAEYRMGMQFEQANDPVKALIHYKRGAEAGDSASNYRLGMMTLLGQNGQQQDFAKGVQLLRQSASSADENAPQGAYVLGMLQVRELPQVNVPEIFLPYDERSARQNIEKAAYLGFARAQLKMGSAYELCSLGCEFNPALSLHYNALAARQGENEAELAISKWFLCGYEGVFQKNEELAFTYAQRAAAAGLDTAEFAMGYYNEVGMTVPVNIEKAREWYNKAAKSGNKDAEKRLEEIAKKHTLSKADHEDMAVQRIKSQYGSMRGRKPERIKASSAAPSLPTISDDSASEYSQSPGSGHPGFGQSPVVANANTPGGFGVTSPGVNPRLSSLPNRNASSTPYPIDDRPPQIDPPVVRPATVTPYPVHDALPPRAGTARPAPSSGYYPDRRASAGAPRPVSEAFTINPQLFSNANANARLSQNYGNGPLPPRPYSSVNELGTGRGRPPPGPRYDSDPAAGYIADLDHRRRSSSSTAQDFRKPGGPIPDRTGGPPGPNQDRPNPPKIDIGFSAPPDERDNRPKKSNVAANTPVEQIGYVAPLKPRPKDSATLPSQQGRQSNVSQAPGRRPSAETPPLRTSNEYPPGNRPQGGDSRPGTRPNAMERPPTFPQQPSQPNKNPGANAPAKVDTKLPTKANAPTQPPTPASAKPSSKPPGKGPKTFEEMGVPVAEKKGNCVSFFLHNSIDKVPILTIHRLSCNDSSKSLV